MGIAGPGATFWRDELQTQPGKVDFSRWQLESFSQTLRAREDGQLPSPLRRIHGNYGWIPSSASFPWISASAGDELRSRGRIPFGCPPDLLIPHSRCFGNSGNAGPGLGGGESFPVIPGNHIPVPEGPRERLRIHMIPKSLSSFSPHQRTTRCRNSGLALGSFSLETEAYSRSSPAAGIWDGAGAPGQGFCHLPSSQRRFREEFFPLCSLWRARGILRLILDLFGMMQPSVGGIPWNSSRWRTPFSVPASHPAQREFGHFCSASLPDRIHERGFKEEGRNVG